MTYDWANYKKFAYELKNSGLLDETKTRNIVSRLFYHSFHCIENWAELKKGYNPSDLGTHKKLDKWLKDNHHNRIEQKYKDFRTLRGICDYDSEITIPLEEAIETAIELDDCITEIVGRYSIRNFEKPLK